MPTISSRILEISWLRPCRREWPGRRDLQMVVFAEYVQTSSAMLAVHDAARRHLRHVFHRKTAGESSCSCSRNAQNCADRKDGPAMRFIGLRPSVPSAPCMPL